MTEETFVRELERRADHVHGAPLSFEDVRGKAHTIRRRRRATAAGVVAAVVALAIVVPTVLAGSPVKRSDGVDPAETPGHAAVLHDGRVTMPDGSTVGLDVDNADVTQLGVLTDGRIVLAMMQPYAVRVYEPDGTLQEQYAVQSNAITMSARDDAVAWVGEDFRVRVLPSGQAEPNVLMGIQMPGEGIGSIDAVLDDGSVLAGDGNTTSAVVTATDNEPALKTPEPLRVTDVSPDGKLWAVRYPDDSDPQFGCAGLYDPDQERMVARNCDTAGLRFAPDGRHVIGMLGDNNMYGAVDILDLDLGLTGRFDPAPAVVSRSAWADSDHVLVAVTNWRNSQWSLIRVGLDGKDPETLEGPTGLRNPETIAEYLLSE